MKRKKSLLIIIGFITGIVNGFLGSGGGTILVPSLVFLWGVKDHNAHATAISIILPITIVSSLVYIKHGLPSYQLYLYATLGSMVGAYFGSKVLNKLSPNLLRKLFGFIMITAAIRMVF